MRTGVYGHIVSCTVYLQKMMLGMTETLRTANPLNVLTFKFLCAWLDFLLTSFVCSLLNCKYSWSQITLSFLAVCLLILGYAVCIFCTTHAKYLMFHVS